MQRRRFERLLGDLRILRHPCALDLLLFFRRHPRVILSGDRLAAYVGYDLNQLTCSLDVLADAGLLERSQSPTHAAPLYVMKIPEIGWLASLLDMASTREGRDQLIQAMKRPSARERTDHPTEHDAACGCAPRPTTQAAVS